MSSKVASLTSFLKKSKISKARNNFGIEFLKKMHKSKVFSLSNKQNNLSILNFFRISNKILPLND